MEPNERAATNAPVCRARRRRGHGEGSIRRRADSRWEARLLPERREGRTKRVSYINRDKAAVVRWLNEKLVEQQNGTLVDPSRVTLETFIRQHYLPTAKATLKPRASADYKRRREHYVIPRIGPTPIQKLQPAAVQSMLAELLESGRKVAPNAEPRGLSAATVHTTRAILRAVLAHAEKLGVVGRNVARLVSPPRVVRYRPTVLVRDQFERFIEAAFGERLGVAMLVSLAVGTRIGEALALGWEDVDLETGSLRVSYALQRVKDEATGKARLVLEEPKSERSRRTLPPPPTVIGWLKRHRARQAEERLLAGGDWRSDKRFVKGGDWQGREFVFTTQTGTPLNDWNLRDALRALEAAKLPHMRFHDLRHSCASFLLSQGAHARLIMEQLGHSQIGITMNLYAHVMPAARKEAADLTDAALDVKMARG